MKKTGKIEAVLSADMNVINKLIEDISTITIKYLIGTRFSKTDFVNYYAKKQREEHEAKLDRFIQRYRLRPVIKRNNMKQPSFATGGMVMSNAIQDRISATGHGVAGVNFILED